MTCRDASRKTWATHEQATTTEITNGALCRIADASEKMAQSHAALIMERDYLKEQVERRRARCLFLVRQRAGLRGYITRLKRKLGKEE